jgi:hypothetical protein
MRLAARAIIGLAALVPAARADVMNPCPLSPSGWALGSDQFHEYRSCIYRRDPRAGFFKIDLSWGVITKRETEFGESGSVGGRPVKWERSGATWNSESFAQTHQTVFRPRLKAAGCDGYPDATWRVTTFARTREERDAIRATLAAVKLAPRPLQAAERYELSDLQLLATHPARDETARWAEFLDPAGKVHRIGYRQAVGPNQGRLKEVGRDRVLIEELCRNEDGEFIVRPVEKALTR